MGEEYMIKTKKVIRETKHEDKIIKKELESGYKDWNEKLVSKIKQQQQYNQQQKTRKKKKDYGIDF